MLRKTYAFLNSNYNCDCSDEPQDFCCNISKYEKYLRKCYKIPESTDVVTKQGFILKEYSDPSSRERLMETESDIDNVINREIKTAMEKMQKFIDKSVENIEILEIQSNPEAMSEVLIHEEIKSEV